MTDIDVEVIEKAIKDAIKLQDFLWHDNNEKMRGFDPADWIHLFQKRVDCLKRIDTTNHIWRQEVRKRLLQQAALSIQAIRALEHQEPQPSIKTPDSRLDSGIKL